jgi:hypothetical protein
MQDPVGEACEAVQAAAAGKDKAAIGRMLTAELRSREAGLPPGLFDVLVKQIAAGTYAPGEPIVSVRRTGLLRVPFIREAIGHLFRPAFEEAGRQVSAGLFQHDGVKVTEREAWPALSRVYPRPQAGLEPEHVVLAVAQAFQQPPGRRLCHVGARTGRQSRTKVATPKHAFNPSSEGT